MPEATCPPRPCQVDDQELPEYSLYHRAPSVPRTKTSILPFACEVTPGDDARPPPRECHADHVAPSQCVYQRAWSVPCTKTSRLFSPRASVAGPVPEASCPPIEAQALQEAPPFVVVFSPEGAVAAADKDVNHASWPVTSQRVTRSVSRRVVRRVIARLVQELPPFIVYFSLQLAVRALCKEVETT